MFNFKKRQFNNVQWNLITIYEIWPEQIIFGFNFLGLNIAYFKVKFTQNKKFIFFFSKQKNENFNSI